MKCCSGDSLHTSLCTHVHQNPASYGLIGTCSSCRMVLWNLCCITLLSIEFSYVAIQVAMCLVPCHSELETSQCVAFDGLCSTTATADLISQRILPANFAREFFSLVKFSRVQAPPKNSRPKLSAFLSDFGFSNPSLFHADFLRKGRPRN